MSKLSTTTKSLLSGMRPIHPGEILLHDFLRPAGLSPTALARALGIPPNRVIGIVQGQRGVTAETAILFEAYFKTSAEFWLNLQHAYELRVASRDRRLAGRADQIRAARKAAQAASNR